MKILILSCGTGQGHNSAAYAIEEVLKNRSIDYILTDPLSFGHKKTSDLVASAYNGIIKNAPGAFGLIYKAGDLYSSSRLTSPVYFANTLYAKKLKNYILLNNFTAVITTHLFAMEALTCIKKDKNFKVPCYGVFTDYTCIPFVAETHLNGYFIPQKDLLPEIVKKGIKENLTFDTGIPVSQKFCTKLKKEEARKALGLNKTKPVILIMSGGVGCGNLVKLCKELLKFGNKDFTALVLVGRNRKLKKEIDRRFFKYNCFKTVSFTKEVNIYMNAADVMVSKPGGLTTTEAAVANIPLVHLLAFSGCETKNADFFSSRGMSLLAKNIKSAVECIWQLIDNKEQADTMLSMQRTYINPNAAEEIVLKVAEETNDRI